MAKCKAEERARKSAERSARLVKKSAPKARAPVSKKRKVDKASSLEPTFENSASKENIVDLNQFQFHKGRNVRLLLRMTIILIRISAVYVSGLSKKMKWRKLAWSGFNVYVSDGYTKTA